MIERVLRLNEQELRLIESGLRGFKRDTEESIDMFLNNPPLIDHRFDQPSVHIKDHKDILEQIENLLKRIEEVR
jgi:hypothetical protein